MHEQWAEVGISGILNRKPIKEIEILPAAQRAVRHHVAQHQRATITQAAHGDDGHASQLASSHASSSGQQLSDDLVQRMQALLDRRPRPGTTGSRAMHVGDAELALSPASGLVSQQQLADGGFTPLHARTTGRAEPTLSVAGDDDEEVPGWMMVEGLPPPPPPPPPHSSADPAPPAIYEKLTDPQQYTGAHKHRFEPTEDGWRGRGIAGRTLEHEQWAESGIAGILNRKPATVRGLTASSHNRHCANDAREGDGRGANRRATTPTRTTGTVYAKLTDPQQYTGAHKHRFEPTEDGWRGRGIAGRTLEHEQWAESGIAGILNRKPATVRGVTATDHNQDGAQRSRRATTPTRTAGTIFARLTDPKHYTGSHKQRFDESGRGRGRAGRTEEHERWAETGIASLLDRTPSDVRGLPMQ
eukprot:COSAG01_NODE_1278_length_10930_cov_22.050226_6_plen_415_part_00